MAPDKICSVNSSETDIQKLYRCATVQHVQFYLSGEIMYLLLGSPLHIYTIYTILSLRVAISRLYALILSVCEIVFTLTVVVGNAFYIGTRNHCILYLVLPSYAFIFTARPLLQSLLCVERYLAVVHPLAYLRYKTPRNKMACSTLVTLVVLGYTAGEAWRTPGFIIFEFAILFIILLSVDMFCSLSVLWALRNPSPGKNEGQKERMNLMKKRAFKTITVILAITFCDHIFVTIMGLTGDFSKDIWICEMDIFNTYIFALCGTIPPLLYLHKMRKLPCVKGRNSSIESCEMS